MAVEKQVPTHPTIYPDAGTVPTGLAVDFRPRVNGYVGTVEDKAQLVQAHLEGILAAYSGGACLSGGTISAGAGLSVNISAFVGFAGNRVANNASTVVGGLAANNTNYIFLRQDSTFTTNTTGAIPGTADGKGTAFLWGYAVTGASGVNSVNNERVWVQRAAGIANISLGTVSDGTVVLTDQDAIQPILSFSGTPSGTVSVHFRPQIGSLFAVRNAGTPAIKLMVPGYAGGSVIIAPGKSAVVATFGSAIYRITADA